MDIIGIANRFQTLLFAPRLDDDFSDRLNYRYTVAVLVLFSVIILTRQSSSDVSVALGLYYYYYFCGILNFV
jgi:hypothetical protein